MDLLSFWWWVGTIWFFFVYHHGRINLLQSPGLKKNCAPDSVKNTKIINFQIVI